MIKNLIRLILTVLLTTQIILAKNYKGGEYRTKEAFLYGRFESSFKAPGKEGTLGTMFTYFDGSPSDPWSQGKWNEIDVEIMGRYNNDVQFNTITPGQINHVRHQYVDFNPALDYHTYAFEWTPDYIAYFIDGVEVYRQTEDFVRTVNRAQKLMFNMWIPNYPNWAGVWNDQVLPAFTYYDWAAYYKYTPGKGNYGSNNDFTFEWKDDFNFFDETRWAKATHTFEGNNVDFVHENIVFENGKMIISLTTPNELGYYDKRPPSIISVRAINEYTIHVFFSEEIDKTSAESASRYLMGGAPPIKKATLLNDNRTVELEVEKLNLNSLPALIVFSGIKDRFVPANAAGNLSKSIIATPQFKFPLKINVGGSSYNDFISDIEFKTDTSNYGYMEGSKGGPFNLPISKTDDDEIFQREVNGMAKYVVRVPNGTYRVQLLFAENHFTQNGQRIFDVYVQGKKELTKFDITKETGIRSAIIKTIENVNVENYLLDIHFSAWVQRPLLNGIIIEQLTTGVDEHSTIPNQYELMQNYPNPFNPDTVISYKISEPSHVRLKIYDLLGKEVIVLVDEFQQPGLYNSKFSALSSSISTKGFSLTSGIYFCELTAGNFTQTKKMVLAK
jgi:beta-glucanase (GH16 family)